MYLYSLKESEKSSRTTVHIIILRYGNSTHCIPSVLKRDVYTMIKV